MKFKWFFRVTTAEELKRQFRHLAVMYHPDRGGNGQIMAEINREYEELLKVVGNIHEKQDGTTYKTKTPLENLDDGYRAVIMQLLTLPGLKILLVGGWVWVEGETKTFKETLKAIGCHWSARRERWYWHPATDGRHRASRESFDVICLKYGVRSIDGETIVTDAPKVGASGPSASSGGKKRTYRRRKAPRGSKFTQGAFTF